VQNYHYWSDLIMAEQSRVFHIPVSLLFFQFFPVFISILTGLGLLALLHEWKGSTRFSAFALFFLYFGADMGYVVYYLIHHEWSFAYPVIDNGATQFLNMPHTIAKCVFLVFFCYSINGLKRKI